MRRPTLEQVRSQEGPRLGWAGAAVPHHPSWHHTGHGSRLLYLDSDDTCYRHVLPDPVQVVRHPGVDPSVSRPGAAHTVAASRRSGGHLALARSPDHPHQCPPALLPDHEGAPAVPLAAVRAPRVGAQLAGRHRAVPRPCAGGRHTAALELQTKVIRRYVKILQSRRRPLLGPSPS